MNKINEILKRNPTLAGFYRDSFCDGPMLDESWSVDSWLHRVDLGTGYCVRAWRPGGDVFIGRGLRFRDACNDLSRQLGFPVNLGL
jgi:hypothetical protein